MTRRTRNLTPWPLATPEQAQWYTIERTRTTAGAALWEATHDFVEIAQRLDVRIEDIRIDDAGEATGVVLTRLDGGEWVNEGGYLLSRKAGAPPLVIKAPILDAEPLPDNWDSDE